MTIKEALIDVGTRATGTTRGPAFRSPAEGYGTLVVALADVFAEVREGYGDSETAREAALELAALAVRYSIEVPRSEEQG